MSSQLETKHQIIDISSRACSTHPSLDCAFICIDPMSKGVVFKCDFCVAEQTLMGKHLIPIKQIRDSDPKTIFYNWPFFSTDILTKLKEIINKPSQEQRYRDDISSYFKDLRKKILDKIDQIQQKMEQKAHKLSDFSNQIISKYNQLSSKDSLKEAVINSSENFNDLSFKIRKMVEEAEKKQEIYEKEMREMLDKVVIQEQAVSLHEPNKIKEDILSSLDKIDMFQFDPQYFAQQSAQEQRRNSQQNVDLIIELVSNKLNFTSSSFQTKLKSHLESIKAILNKMDLGNVYVEGKERLQLELLNEEEVQEVSRFIKTLTQSKNQQSKSLNSEQEKKIEVNDIVKLVGNQMNFASEEMCYQVRKMLQNVSNYVNSFKVKSVLKQEAKMIDLDQTQAKKLAEILPSFKPLLSPQEPNNENRLKELIHFANQVTEGRDKIEGQQYWDFKQMISLLKHPANRCSQEQIQEFNNSLEGIKYYLESIKQNQGEPKPMNWNELNNEQINSLEKLGNKMQALNEEFGDEYKNGISPNPVIQLQSSEVVNNLLPLTEKEEKDVRSILVQYPVFEMVPFAILQQVEWHFIKTNYSSSQQLELYQTQNGYHIFQKKNMTASSVTNSILDNTLTYQLTCKFNKPLVCNYIAIGLILDEKIHSHYVGHTSHQSIFYSYPGNGARELIKGDYLNGDKLRKDITEIQFKFCIGEKKFYYCDQAHQNINKVKPDLINQNAKYRFGIYFGGPGDDWNVQVSHVKATRNNWLIDKF